MKRWAALSLGLLFFACGEGGETTLERTERALAQEDGSTDRILAVPCDVSRPDQVVAWRGDDCPKDCDELMGQIVGFAT